MKKIRWLFILGTSVATIVVSITMARGSVRMSEPVVIQKLPDGSGYSAQGSLGSVRAQGGSSAMLYCRIEAAAALPANGNMIICHAADVNNFNQVECLLAENDQEHSLTAAVAGMNGDSYVYFEVNTGPPTSNGGPVPDGGVDGGPVNANGTCTRLKIENGSMYAPKLN